MKYLKYLCLLFLCLMMPLTSCHNQAGTEPFTAIQHMTEDLPEGQYFLPNGEKHIFVYENQIYAAGKDVLGIYTLPEMEYTKLADLTEEPAAVTASSDMVYLQQENVITVYSEDGQVQNTWTLPLADAEEVKLTNIYLGRTGDILWSFFVSRTEVNGQTITEDKLYSIHMADHTITECDLDTDKANMLIDVLSISPVEGEPTVCDIFGLTSGITENGKILLRYSQEKNTILQYTEYPDHLAFLAGTYTTETDTVYGITGFNGYMQIFSYDPSEDTLQQDLWINTEEYVTDVTALTGRTVRREPYPTVLGFTGHDFLVWDAPVLSVYDKKQILEEETLCVLYAEPDSALYTEPAEQKPVFRPESIAASLQAFAAENDCAVKTMTYPEEEFSTRLQMKLLASENDFDVMYLSGLNSGSLFAAILKYQLYLPLETVPGISENFEEYLPGIRELMTSDGHLYGIPYHMTWDMLGVFPEYAERDLPLLQENMTYEDFWDICAAAALNEEEDKLLTQIPYIWILYPILQDGIDKGVMDEDAVTGILRNLQIYTENGVLSKRWQSSNNHVLRCVQFPYQDGISYNMNFQEWDCTVPPVSEDIQYVTLTCAVMGNAGTEKKELTGEYLRYISSKDQIYAVEDSKSWLGKNADAYYRLIWDNGLDENNTAEDFTWNRRQVTMNGWGKWIHAHMSAADYTLKPMTISRESVQEYIDDSIVNQLLEGTITAEEAAAELCRKMEYLYLE